MESVKTKEVSPALSALSKHKNRANRPANVATQPVGIVIQGEGTLPPKIEAATPVPAPANPPVTPVQTPEPQTPTRNYEDAWKQLKGHHDKTTHELRQENERLRKLAEDAQKVKTALPKTKAEIEAYRKQYPEAMDIFTTIALETTGAEVEKLKAELAEVNKFKTELKDKEAFKDLLKFHPDAMEIKKSPEFLAWYNEQPRVIQDILAHGTDVTAVAKQLTLYKLEVLGINPKAKAKEEAAAAVEASLGVNVSGHTEIGTQKKQWTQTEINAICADYNTWLKFRVEIDDAVREKRVDYSK